MRIAYLFNRDSKKIDDMKADRVYADNDKTKRVDRSYLLDKGGIVEGDVIVVRQLKDLGGNRIQRMIEAKGATVEVVTTDDKVRQRGRPTKWTFSASDMEALSYLWYYAGDPNQVFVRANEMLVLRGIKDGPPNRKWFERQFGPRDGSRKPEKKQDKKEREDG